MPGLGKGVGGKYSIPDQFDLMRREALLGVGPEEIICDFCSSRAVVWDYENHPTEHEDGGWAACDPCSELIEMGDRQALEDRAVAMAPPTMMKDGLRRQIQRTQGVFWDNRKEDRKPIS